MQRFGLEVVGRLRGRSDAILARSVLFGLMAMVRQGNLVTATRHEIGDTLGLSQPTLRKGLGALEAVNAIRCPHLRLIELNPRLFWHGSESARKDEIEQWQPEFARKVELRAVT